MTHFYLYTIAFVAVFVAGIAFWKHRADIKAKVDNVAEKAVKSAEKKL